MNAVERILCVRRGALGDTVLMEPVLRALRTRWPEARLELAGDGDHAAVLQHFGAVDRAFSSELLRAGRPRRYDLVLTEEPGLDRGRAPAVLGLEPRLGAVPRAPAAAQLLARARQALPELPAVDPAPRVGPGWCGATADEVVLHPGSGGVVKCWPRERYAALARALRERGWRVAEARGPVERERGGASLPVDVLLELSITALAERLRGARAFVGNDAGVTHLAAALGVPTVALFGPTDPAVWAPPDARVVARGRLGEIRVEDVLVALRAVLGR